MRPIVLTRLDKARPALILTRDVALDFLNKVTIAPITSTIRSLSTEVPLGTENGLDHPCVASCDNITTVPKEAIVRQIGFLLDSQEPALAKAIGDALDLALPA